ncbi:MAG: OB-fold nucleic acid binding domain-containing protein, partial [Steroidobacteraceae bacterium]
MTDTTPPVDENKLIAERRAKLDRLREQGQAFPNDFRRDALAEQLHVAYGERPAEWFDANPIPAKVGGRIMVKRIMGKASFVKINDRSGQIQLFLQQATLAQVYDEFKT